MRKRKNSWSDFAVGDPADKGFNADCRVLSKVTHTAHVRQALEILNRREIRPYLVFDESILNDQRILVSWLSPNEWTPGYRYGNVSFGFNFEELIKGKRAYWVEAIAYNTQACRILITDNEHGNLESYDPTTKDGPWWYDVQSKKHYFNGNFCLEFMFEAKINLDNLRSLKFVKHHETYCSVYRASPKDCLEIGLDADRGGARFLAGAIAHESDLTFVREHLVQDSGAPSNHLEAAFNALASAAIRTVKFDGRFGPKGLGITLAKAIAAFYSRGNIKEARELAALFASDEALEIALAKIVSDLTGVDDYKHFLAQDS